jgi:hypothetical protein
VRVSSFTRIQTQEINQNPTSNCKIFFLFGSFKKNVSVVSYGFSWSETKPRGVPKNLTSVDKHEILPETTRNLTPSASPVGNPTSMCLHE